jgi:hypothetical protein
MALALIFLAATPPSLQAADVSKQPAEAMGPWPAMADCLVVDPCAPFVMTPGAGVGLGTVPPPLAVPGPSRGPASGYAHPTAAPPSAPPKVSPSQTPTPPKPAPPSGAPKPAVSEVRSYYDIYPVAPDRSSRPLGERCSIEFWNLTNHDLALKVGGAPHPLKPGQNLLLELPRHFVWQLESREPQRENIPFGESALEIVIRR